MFSTIWKKILSFTQESFELIFTDEFKTKHRLQKLDLVIWQTLAKPTTHSNNTLSVFEYENSLIRDALYFIKNKKDSESLESMVKITVDILLEDLSEAESLLNFTSPILVSIPSAKSHTLKRGYNPSELIAQKISNHSGIPFVRNILHKSKDTPAQKNLSRYERLLNVKNSMDIHKKHIVHIEDKCIIIVDDIMTTGATLKEAKRVLLKNGARKVMGVVLAH